MSTTDSPWDDTADLPSWHYASIYGPEAEFARFRARTQALARKYEAERVDWALLEARSDQILETLKTLRARYHPPAPPAP